MDSQFSLFLVIVAGESTTIQIDFFADAAYDSLIVESHFGNAEAFVHFERSTGELTIEPDQT